MFGDIYRLTSRTSGKSYIGQAQKKFGRFDSEWGYLKRWRSHVYEATSDAKDHCTVLNNAIRKYGKDDFNVELLCECETPKDLDERECYYIYVYDTLVPNGYNLERGGRDNRKFSDTAKANMSAGQDPNNKYIGGWNIIDDKPIKQKRKYIEDNKLPKYIYATRDCEGHIFRYFITRFPVNTTKPRYISRSFPVKKNDTSPNDALERAVTCLNKLKIDYNFAPKKNPNPQNIKNEIVSKRTMHPKKTETPIHKLPEHVYPLYNPKRLKIGYYVHGILDHNGKLYPKKDFKSLKNNAWDLNDAVKYIEKCRIKNIDASFKIPDYVVASSRYRRSSNKDVYNLPKYMVIPRDKNNVIKGFTFKLSGVENGRGFVRSFTDPWKTLNEKFKLCYDALNAAKEKYGIVDEIPLPRYVLKTKKKGIHVGYKYALRSVIKENGRYLQRFFTNPQFTMNERYNMCITELEKDKLKYNITE